MLVHRIAGGLHDKHIHAAHVLEQLEVNLAVGKALQLGLAHLARRCGWPISSASGRLAVPLKSLKRLSSLRLRVRLRSGAGLASFALACPAVGRCGDLSPRLRLPSFAPSPAACLPPLPSPFPLPSPSTSKLVGFGCFPVFQYCKTLAGRLGFEPRQVPPKGTVLPLDDRPTQQIPQASGTAALTAVRESLSATALSTLLCQKHFAPVFRSRQGAGQLLSTPGRPQPFPGRLRISPGQVQPEERRTGPGQRSMEGCLRSAGAARMRLISAREGCWGKTTRSKSFWNPARDPGADKRGLLWSGQVLSTREDTGGACSLLYLAGMLPQRRWHRRGSTSFSLDPRRSGLFAVKPSVAQSASQSRKAWGVETPTSGMATTHQIRLDIRQRITSCPRRSENCSADQEKRHIGADLGCNLQSVNCPPSQTVGPAQVIVIR